MFFALLQVYLWLIVGVMERPGIGFASLLLWCLISLFYLMRVQTVSLDRNQNTASLTTHWVLGTKRKTIPLNDVLEANLYDAVEQRGYKRPRPNIRLVVDRGPHLGKHEIEGTWTSQQTLRAANTINAWLSNSVDSPASQA